MNAPPQASPAPVTPALRLARGGTGLLLGMTQGFGLYLVGNNLSSIQGSLAATAAEASWMITAYFATAMSSTLLLTKMRLHIGLRPFAIFGLWLFLAVAGLHLFADELVSAVALRAALGLAAAPLSTLAILYMLEAMPMKLAPVALLLGFASLQLPGPLSRVVAPDLLEIGRWHGLFLLDVVLGVFSLAAIYAVPLTPQAPKPAFNRGDLIAFPLYAAGLAFLGVVLSQGRLAWWTDTPWLGMCLVAAVVCIGLYVLIDLNRPQPLLDLRWLTTPYMLRFIAAVLLFRMVLSEQTVGVVGLMTVLGQSNEQMRTLFALASGGMLFGFLLAIVIAAKQGMHLLSVLAIALVLAVSWADSDATSVSRPEQFYLTQTFLALALALFFAAALLLGFGPVMQDGGRQIVSFLAAFSGAQYLGSLMGTAWINTLVAERQTLHFSALAQHLAIGDPMVAQRIAQLTGSVARWIGDPAARGRQGLTLLNQQVTRESFVLAYNDVFIQTAGLATLMLVWLSVLAWRGIRKQRALAAS
ncbi:hypothetical protein [Roseateles sp.]|uniref:hypothetical protein n=1 Tax=Roseateles sp. TaxID=1971397 RepID=UPI0039E93F4E